MLSYQRPNLDVCASVADFLFLRPNASFVASKPGKRTRVRVKEALLNVASKRSDKFPVCVIPTISTSSDTADLSLIYGKVNQFSYYTSRCGPLCHQSMNGTTFSSVCVKHIVISKCEPRCHQ